MPIAILPYTHFIAHRSPTDTRLFTFTRARAIYANARVSACERLLQRDHAVVPDGGRGEESDEDGAARPGGPGSRLLRYWLSPVRPCEAGSRPRCCFIVALGLWLHCSMPENEQTYTRTHCSYRARADRESGLFKRFGTGLALVLIWLDCRVFSLFSVRSWFVHFMVDSLEWKKLVCIWFAY
jgi:hypothetical protein